MTRKVVTVVGMSAVFGVFLGLIIARAARVEEESISGTARLTRSVPVLPTSLTDEQQAILDGIRGSARAGRITSKEWRDVQQIERMTTNRGTRVSEATARELGYPEQRRMIAGAIHELDFTPAPRRAHFAWCLEDEKFNVVGWDALFTAIEPSRDGGWVVELHVRPHFEQRGGILHSQEYCVERYKFLNGQLQFIPAEHPHRSLDAGALLQD